MAKVGWAPRARRSSFVTRGCAGSRLTGPGPDAGGMNSPDIATQPTLGLGAKLGVVFCALAVAMERTPASAEPAANSVDLTIKAPSMAMADDTPASARTERAASSPNGNLGTRSAAGAPEYNFATTISGENGMS